MRRQQYAAWQRKRLLELYTLWDAEIRRKNPGAVYFPNGFEQIQESVSVPILFADRQCRSEFQLPWQNGKYAKDARAISGSKPIVGIFSVGYEAPYRWKDSSQNPNEVRLWAVDGIAQGFRPWVVKFNAKPLDKRWFKPVEDLYVWHWKNEKYLRNQRPLARVGLVSAPRADLAGSHVRVLPRPGGRPHPVRNRAGQPIRRRAPEAFKVLALPNVANLSDAQCAQLKAFVEKGGGLVATHETSLHDEHGQRREDFGLDGLFGASFAGNVIERQQNAYLNLEDHSHPLLAGLGFASRMIHGVKRVEIRTAPGLRAPLMTVPTYPDLPIEEVYVRDMKNDIPECWRTPPAPAAWSISPGISTARSGKSCARSTAMVLANAVRWAANEEQPFRSMARACSTWLCGGSKLPSPCTWSTSLTR